MKMMKIKKCIACIFCFVMILSVYGIPVQAVVTESKVESGSAYLVKPNGWSPCAVFSASKSGVTFHLKANDPNATDYNVRLCAGEPGMGIPVESCYNVPIGTSVAFVGLTVGTTYYFDISSGTITGNGAGAVYTLSVFDAQHNGSDVGGYSVKFQYNNGADISVGIFLGIKGEFVLTEAPVYAGYTFAGWSDGTTVHQPGDVVNVTQDMRFDAMWTESIPARNPFADVKQSDAYFDAVMHVYEKGIMVGTASATFSPDAPVTRAAVWTVLARINGIDTDGGDTWYEKAREWAVSTGISDGSDPERTVSRQEIITMLYRQAGRPPVKNPGNYATSFGDMADVADWAYDPVIWAIQNNLLQLYYSGGMLDPAQGALRWELAYLLTQYDMNIG